MLVKLEDLEICQSTEFEPEFSATTSVSCSNLNLTEIEIESNRTETITDIESSLPDNLLPWNEELEFEDFRVVERLLSSIKKTSVRQAMVDIYSTFMEWETQSKYNCCDEVLRSLNESDYDLRIMVSILMATSTMKDKLNYRESLLSRTKSKARIIYEQSEYDAIFGIF